MKVFVPRNIEKGMLNMNFQLWPITVSLVQLVLVAMGVWSWMMIWNGMTKAGADKILAGIPAWLIVFLFLFIAFFNVTELWLLPYAAKLRRTRFLDTTKKFQTNDTKIDSMQIMIKESHANYEDVQEQEHKVLSSEYITKKKLSSDDLLS